MQGEPFATSLIVRVTVTENGAVNGVVERPRTGEKHRFEGVEALGVLVAQIAKKAAHVTVVAAALATAAIGPFATSAASGAPGSTVASQEVFS
jgi:hypothetical protein